MSWVQLPCAPAPLIVRVWLTTPALRRPKAARRPIAAASAATSGIWKGPRMTIVSTEPPLVPVSRVPVSDVDPYSDAALIEPWDVYRELQDLGPAVWLVRYQMFALTQYECVVKATGDLGEAVETLSGCVLLFRFFSLPLS